MFKDLSSLVEFPQSYRHAGIPRAINWDQVEKVLASVDRRSPCGKRDYAMLLLLSTYGLRACEVAALTLDDIDWRNERFRIRERKAGNTTTYPLSAVAGAAIIDYLKNGRPVSTDREVFMRMAAPLAPIGDAAVVCRAAHFICKAGINVPRAGSHVLRHSCVQRLLNAHFSLKHIGDYVGHRNISSTQIYGKLAIEQLRYVAQGDGGCAMTPRTRFKSFLGPDVEQFLTHKRSLGRRYDVEEKTLALLDAYLLQKRISRISEVTPTLVDEFLLSRPRPRARSYNHLRCTIGRFFSYLVDRGKLAATPLQSPPRRSRYERTPFIFDMAAAQRLLALAKTLPDKGGTMERGSTYFVLFAVLYGLGLRVGEACRLRIKDVDCERQLLVIRETKFYNYAASLTMFHLDMTSRKF